MPREDAASGDRLLTFLEVGTGRDGEDAVARSTVRRASETVLPLVPPTGEAGRTALEPYALAVGSVAGDWFGRAVVQRY